MVTLRPRFTRKKVIGIGLSALLIAGMYLVPAFAIPEEIWIPALVVVVLTNIVLVYAS
jgi:hypothetical protein